MPAPQISSGFLDIEKMPSILRGLSCVTCCFALSISAATFADALDQEVAQDSFLATLDQALAAYDIDVAHNLNSRVVVRQRIRRPRLGRFPDLPAETLPTSREISTWEAEYAAMQIGGIAILGGSQADELNDGVEFVKRWLDSPSEQRLFVSFYQEDQVAADKIRMVSDAYGFNTQLFLDAERLTTAGKLYATAAQRLAIDTRAARRYRTEVTELDFLGKRVRRNSNSLFRNNDDRGGRSLARREPTVFLKETLGDEFTQATIREIVVPGGVALGETASLAINVVRMEYADGALHLVSDDGSEWQLPAMDVKSLKTLFDLVNRSVSIGSDAIVDIDAEGRVRISSALRNTDVGYEIMHADTLPFDYVPNLQVTKSVVIDIGIEWFPDMDADVLAFETDYEVRFLSADNMRIAQTRVALAYHYESLSGASTFRDSWGRYARRLSDNLDYSGLGSSMVGIANYAGWVGLFRRLREDRVPFLHGRYEFMKIDKSGRDTPSRY